MDPNQTHASDWRSAQEKEKSLLRKASASLFKTWIPDHPEASTERGEVHRNLRDAFSMFGSPEGRRVTFVSLLSSGTEDIMAHEYHDAPLSAQELLVQREGTEAFLDPKTALRVVRRKFGMMTLIGRMASTFEQRNLMAVTIEAEVDQSTLIEFGRLLATRIEGTAAEEEQALRKKFRRGSFPHIDLVFHSDVIGRRLPVPWPIKHYYTLLARDLKAQGGGAGRSADHAAAGAAKLNPKALRQLALYAAELRGDIETDFDPADDILREADERTLLTVTRNIFDEFQLLRRERDHSRAMAGTPAPSDVELDQSEVAEAIGDDFLDLAEAGGTPEDDEFLRLAQGLEKVRVVRGRDFFTRISMVSGDMSFVDAARGAGFEGVEASVAQQDPVQGLADARKVTEPFYRARALASVVPLLKSAGHEDEAKQGAIEALEAARKCQTTDVDQAYNAALTALIHVGDDEHAAVAVKEGLEHAHGHKEQDERGASLMRVVSTLMEAGPLPARVKASLSREILGRDVHFWGKKAVGSALVEVTLSLLSPDNDDTLIFLQKVVAHPDLEVRKSVVRTMPFTGEALRNMLLSHLRDPEVAVRVEVIERIGWSGEKALALYLVNHVRQGQATSDREKRAVALNLARLDPTRYVPFLNAMLGSLGHKSMLGPYKAIKDDEGLQMAALEVLYHLNSRDARRLLFHTSEQGKGAQNELCKRIWHAVKSAPYGDPELPRSPHDPAWTEEDEFDLLQVLDRDAPLEALEAPEPEPEAEKRPASTFKPKKKGLFGRLKAKIFGDADDEVGVRTALGDADEDDEEGDGAAPEEVAARPVALGRPAAALRFEAVLLEGQEAFSGKVPVQFAIYTDEAADDPVWRERHDLSLGDTGHFEVMLGLRERLPSALPNIVWLGMDFDNSGEVQPRTRISRARSVVQG